MENQTMNTNKEKCDKNFIQTGGNTFKLYRWKKEWVRPYESIYSIMRNFCKVNVFQGSYALRILDVRGYSAVEHPIPNIMMFNKTVQDARNYKMLYSVLLPDWYVKQITPITSLDKYKFSNLTKSHIAYCPECAKENYHSFLFQFKHIKRCPFHHIPLINTLFHYTIQGNITYMETELYTDVKDDILPCERKVENNYYQKGLDRTLRYFIPVSSMSDINNDNYIHAYKIFFDKEKSSAAKIFQVKKSGLTFQEMKV